MTLYMFRTVFPSIIRSSRLYIQQQSHVKQTAVPVWLLYVHSRTPDDGRKDRPKHVEYHSKIKYLDTLVHLVGFTTEITDNNLKYRNNNIKYGKITIKNEIFRPIKWQ